MKCYFGDAVEDLSGKLMKDALVTAAAYLVNELPIKVQVFFDSKFLHPKKQQARSTPGAISRLRRSVVSSLPEETIKKEFKVSISHVDVVVEVVSSEFRKYQMEIIPESFYLLSQTSEASKGRKQSSYWKYAYGIAEIEHASERQEEESSYDRIDSYWGKALYRALETDFFCLSLT